MNPGDSLGPYRVVSALGAGGMGEVYRATDHNLKRAVALKVLPAALAGDAERLARFQREAEVLAALNHPNIAAIYGLEKSGDLTALVMELVEGDDLSQRLARGPLPLEDALPIARQIAEALEAAHEQGIVHRDLKPANVKVRPDGAVKVLDFGLAKAVGPAGASGVDPATSPTLTAHATQMGVILGTAAYMAPEQARGKPVDRRADIWAFGVVLYEMLSGRRAFAGEDVSDVLAAVLRQDIDWSALPADTPPGLRRLLERCLERDPKQRLRDIGEARVLLSRPLDAARPQAEAATHAPGRLARVAPWALALAASLVAALAFWRSPASGPTSGAGTLRFAVAAPASSADLQFSTDINLAPVLSPDGRLLAIPLQSSQGEALFVRPLNDFTLTAIEGGGRKPFFSPDGRFLMIRPAATEPIHVQIVLNWLDEVRARLAAAQSLPQGSPRP